METENKKIDFLAIGDTVTDAFIRLEDAEVHCKVDNTACELCVRFGDKVPYKEVTIVPAVGNAANAAVSAARLGLRTALVTNLGKDREGEECMENFKKENISTDFVKMHDGIKTNYHYVLLYEVDRTILIKHEKYPYTLPDIGEPEWIYFSSVGAHAYPFHNTVVEYLEKHPNIKLAFQPGKNEIKLGVEKMAGLYRNATIFFCNVEEAQVILNNQSRDLLELSKGIMALGPKLVAISDGPNGAYFYDGTNLYSIPLYPDTGPAIDRTGAGDAFASTFTAALALGQDPTDAFAWGPINSMSVVQQIGAQKGLLSREKLEQLLKNAPEHYKVTKIN
ncbi:MAG: carbohydrate kinase family protein [Candidatus Paceibacteria bacterium]